MAGAGLENAEVQNTTRSEVEQKVTKELAEKAEALAKQCAKELKDKAPGLASSAVGVQEVIAVAKEKLPEIEAGLGVKLSLKEQELFLNSLKGELVSAQHDSRNPAARKNKSAETSADGMAAAPSSRGTSADTKPAAELTQKESEAVNAFATSISQDPRLTSFKSNRADIAAAQASHEAPPGTWAGTYARIAETGPTAYYQQYLASRRN